MDVAARLLANREIADSGCWIWTRSCNPDGYGQCFALGTVRLVHRVAASLWMGFDLASPLCVLHNCDNPPCFNPEHLFVGTRADNTDDMMAKGRNAYTTHSIARETVEKALRLVDEGRSQRSAARTVGVSHTAVQTWLRDRNHQI